MNGIELMDSMLFYILIMKLFSNNFVNVLHFVVTRDKLKISTMLIMKG